MSVVNTFPYAVLKQWIQPFRYAVGITPEGATYPSASFSSSLVRTYGTLNTIATFDYPVLTVYFYTYFNNVYTQPAVVRLDYPAFSVGLFITIGP